jgi:hypothetical protein
MGAFLFPNRLSWTNGAKMGASSATVAEDGCPRSSGTTAARGTAMVLGRDGAGPVGSKGAFLMPSRPGTFTTAYTRANEIVGRPDMLLHGHDEAGSKPADLPWAQAPPRRDVRRDAVEGASSSPRTFGHFRLLGVWGLGLGSSLGSVKHGLTTWVLMDEVRTGPGRGRGAFPIGNPLGMPQPEALARMTQLSELSNNSP